MALERPTRARTYQTEHQFGLSVGTVFALLSVWSLAAARFQWWFGPKRFAPFAPWTLGLGLALIVFGALFPRALVLPNRGWMRMAEAMSFVMTRVILALVFFLLVTPIGFVKRVTGWDPLRRRAAPAPSYWKPYSDRQRDTRHYERMF